MTKQKLQELATALDYAEFVKDKFGKEQAIFQDKMLRAGIGYLDFDPKYFLASDITSLEGWATK